MRQSNIELLRIVSMSFILILHFLKWAIGIESMNPYLFQALTICNICGVNLFLMISGFFGIKWSKTSFIRLTGLIVIFSLFCLLCSYFIFDEQISLIRVIKAIILPFTSTGYWFLQSYLGLYMIAPLLTRGLDCLSGATLKKIILIITIVCVFSCWYGGNKLNADGYGVFHFIYLYIIGYGLEHLKLPSLHCLRWTLFALSCLFVNIFDLYFNDFNNKYSCGAAIAYDNPFVLLASIAMFMAFVTLNINNSKIINSIASCSLGCYLLQDGSLRLPIYSLQHNFVMDKTTMSTILMFTFSFIIFWILSYIIHQIYNTSFNYLRNAISTVMQSNKRSLI